jgi:hypothetical protein
MQPVVVPPPPTAAEITATAPSASPPASATQPEAEAATPTEASTQDATAPEGEADPQAAAPAPEAPGWKRAADSARRSSKASRRVAEEAQRLRQEHAQALRQLEWERQERAKEREQFEKRDPLELLRARGVTPAQLAQEAIKQGTPEAKIQSLEAKLEAERQARLHAESVQLESQKAAQLEKAYSDFLSEAADKAKYPTLAKLARAKGTVLCKEGDAVVTAVYERTGQYPSYSQVLAYLEHEYSNALRDDEPTGNGAQQAGTVTSNGKAAGGSRTLTSKANGMATLPKQMDDMSRDEQLAHITRQLLTGSRG